jgi:ureidoacrylate peracid hydrolase
VVSSFGKANPLSRQEGNTVYSRDTRIRPSEIVVRGSARATRQWLAGATPERMGVKFRAPYPPYADERGIQMVEIDGRQILTTLEEKVSPEHAAILVIDMQHEFIAEGGFWDELGQDLSEVQAVATRLGTFLDAAREQGVRIVHIRAIYDPEYMTDPMYERLHRHGVRKYCQSDDPASSFYPGLEPRENEPEVQKHRFDAFHGTELDSILRGWGVKTVVCTGLVTHGCVDSTARHAYFNGYYVVFPPELTGGASEEVKRVTVETMNVAFGVTPTAEEIVAAWKQVPAPLASQPA